MTFSPLKNLSLAVLALAIPALQAQPIPLPPSARDSARLTFDVASIKPSAPGASRRFGCQGGPGTSDPTRIVCTNISSLFFVRLGYGLEGWQLSAPEGGNNDLLDVQATMPEGTTKEQYQAMLRSVALDRFKLAFHTEQKEIPIYELMVGKGGAKVKAHQDTAAGDTASNGTTPQGGPPNITKGTDGFPVVPAGTTIFVMMGDGARYQVYGETMDKAASTFSNYADRPVIDATGLKGKYDFSAYWVPYQKGTIPPADAPGPTMTEAIEQQLGLKLAPVKRAVDVLVIDHLEKKPTEN